MENIEIDKEKLQLQSDRRCLPAGAKVAVRIRKSGGKLAKVTVERRGEAFECDTKVFVKGFKNGERQSTLRALTFVARLNSHERLITFQKGPNAR